MVKARNLALQHTELEHATPGNIRTRLLRIGAQVRVSVRRVVIALPAAFPAPGIFVRAARKLFAVPVYVGPG